MGDVQQEKEVLGQLLGCFGKKEALFKGVATFENIEPIVKQYLNDVAKRNE